MTPLKVFALASCDSCRRARRFLHAAGIPFEEIPIRESPPSLPELRSMLAAYSGEVRRLFNTSGQEYRASRIAAKLPSMSADEALFLLVSNGNLVKRPFAVGKEIHLTGFDEATWKAAFP